MKTRHLSENEFLEELEGGFETEGLAEDLDTWDVFYAYLVHPDETLGSEEQVERALRFSRNLYRNLLEAGYPLEVVEDPETVSREDLYYSLLRVESGLLY